MTQLHVVAISSAALALLAGCGGSNEPQRHPLSGSVIVEGTEVAKGTISFLPAQGNQAQPAHTSIADGKYRFSKANGPFAGPHRVVIGIKTKPEDEPTVGEAGGQSIKEAAPVPRRNRFRPPPKPNKLQWEVEYTVPEDGDGRKDFELHE